jgi:hypothetical protein
MVTRDQILIGTKIEANGIIFEVTEIFEKKNYCKGFQIYKGKKIELILFFSQLSNPHYMNNYKLVGSNIIHQANFKVIN